MSRATIVFLDCGVSKSETPQRLAERLTTVLTANDIAVQRNASHSNDRNLLTIRWGTTRYSDMDTLSKAILNPARSIFANLDKRNAHRLMYEAGVSVPLFWTSFNQARRASRELGCDFLRRRLHHMQGTDIIRLHPTDTLSSAKRSGYYVQLLAKTAEYRLHILNGTCIGLAEKKPKDGERANQLIWNFENGWDLIYYSREERESAAPHYAKMVEEATKACKAVGLNFGAVDLVMVGSKPYILELNTSPKLAGHE